MDGLKPNTAYYYQALIKVDDKYVGDVTGIEKNEILADEIMSFTTKPVFVLTTGEVKDKTANSATLSGTVENYDPNDETFQFAFFYSTSSDVMNAWDGKSVVATYDNNGNLMAEISGLTDYTTYYYTLAVKRGESAFESSETKSFTTLPVVSTVNNATTTSNSATLSGTCSKGITVTGFAVKKDGASEYATYSAVVDGSGNFSATIDGLEANTTYRYYAFIKDGEKTYPGEEYRFTTKQLPVTVATGTTSNVTANSATLSGTVENYDPSDGSVQFAFFCAPNIDVMWYGVPVVATYDNNGNLTAEVTGLRDFFTYYYTLAVKQGNGDFVPSEIKSFTTLPVVSTAKNATTTSNSVALSGTCSEGITVAGFSVKKEGTSDYTFYSASVDTDGNISATIDGLDANSSYYYYVFIRDDEVTYMGNEYSFTTLCPDDNHPHMIDLGLPSGIKWACCNVGAANPEEFGGYYAWGEINEKESYSPHTYQHAVAVDDNEHGGIWYDEISNVYKRLIDIGSDIAGSQYDVAHVTWGGNWKLPTKNQFDELVECSRVYRNNHCGLTFVGANGKCVELPAAGHGSSSIENRGAGSCDWGHYWSSSLEGNSDNQWAYILRFWFSWEKYTNVLYDSRFAGFSIRPVWE